MKKAELPKNVFLEPLSATRLSCQQSNEIKQNVLQGIKTRGFPSLPSDSFGFDL
jgi:hypothetical protein